MEQPVITLENVSYSYNGIFALEDISLDIFEKDFIGIIGPNGGGKTTLLKLILGFLKPRTGSITVMGENPVSAREYIGYVPQYGNIDTSIPITVEEVVAMGAHRFRDLFPRLKSSQRKIAEEMMILTGIADLAGKPFGSLSGGQRQRCLIARALASKPQILLLDEPTANVDSTMEQDIYDLFRDLNDHTTILLVSHDVGFISSYVNRVACINQKISVHQVDEITQDTVLNKTYGGDTLMIKHRCRL